MLIILVLAVAPVVSMALDKTLEPCQKEFVRGHRAYKDGDFGTAASAFLKCDGNYPLLQKYITEFLLKVGSGGDKFQYIDPAVQNSVEIEMTMTPFDLANAYFKARDYAKAEELFKEVLKTSDYHLAHVNLCRLYAIRIKNFDQAEAACEEAARKLPNNLQLWFYLAIAKYENGKQTEALEIASALAKNAPSQETQYLYEKISKKEKLEF